MATNRSLRMGIDMLLIGCAAGFSGDCADAAARVVESLIPRGQHAFLVFETLAERTLALAHLRRRSDPSGGYELQLEAMPRPVLAKRLTNGNSIVGNFYHASPQGAARRTQTLARKLKPPAPCTAMMAGHLLKCGVPLRKITHDRTGDRGDRSSISVIA